MTDFPGVFRMLESTSPEAAEALAKMPADVQAVVADFEKDYLAALTQFKEAYVSMLSWAMRACDELQMMKSYLEAERLRQELGLTSSPSAHCTPSAPPRSNPDHPS